MPNRVRIEDGTAILTMKGEVETVVDVADLPAISEYSWSKSPNAMGGFYAATSWRGKTLYLHRVLLGVTDRRQKVDHINHDTLDNRRSNLRVVSNQTNMLNRKGANRNSVSGVRGVHRYMTQQGLSYWKAVFHLGSESVRKYFPFTDEGKEQAAVWIAEQRARYVDQGEQLPPRNPNAKLTEEQVREIRRRRRAGERNKDLAAEFGLTPMGMSHVCRGDVYGWVKD